MGGSPAASRPAGQRGGGRCARQRAVRAVEPGADVPVHLRPSHVRVRHDERAPGPDEGDAQQPRVQQPQGVLQDPRHDRRRPAVAVDRQAGVPPARLLRRDRQRHVHHRDLGRPGPPPAPAARVHHVGGRSRQQTLRGERPTSAHPITRQAGYYAERIIFRNAGVEPDDIQLTGCYDAFTFTPILLFEGYGFCQVGRGRRVRHERHHRPRRRPSEQHQRRAPLRGLHARHEHGDRERAPTPPHGRRLLSGRGARRAHLRLLAKADAARCATWSWP